MGKAKLETKYLGKTTNKPTTELDLIDWKGDSRTRIVLECSEFTSFCPVTSQPDFAKLFIEYIPYRDLVETKSLKLFLWSFRTKAQFNEKLVDHITQVFYKQVNPQYVKVTGKFNARGGISVYAECKLGDAYNDDDDL